MSGSRYVLDTNAVIALLGSATSLRARLEEAEWLGLSIISRLEFLALPDIAPADVELFGQLAQRVEVVGLTDADHELVATTIDLRRKYRMKLPDAIIAATAIVHDAVLVTDDRHFSAVAELRRQSVV
jgi:tRNA(fMet)-specific endonuclease VapC